MYKLFFSILCFSLLSGIVDAQEILKGRVFEKGGTEPIPFVNIIALPSGEGTTTDFDGNFVINTDKKINALSFSFIGYETLRYKLTDNLDSIKIILFESDIKIDETVIIAKKRKIKKDTAAITLFRNVVRNKPENKPKGLDSYHYREHSKIEFDLYKYKAKLRNQFYMKPFAVAFDYEDTTVSGNLNLPAFLQEELVDVYYNKDPEKNKRIILANMATGVENVSATIILSNYLEKIDMYENVIVAGGKPFTSPFAPSGLLTYRYFLSDSIIKDDGTKLYRLDFSPRNKQSIAFNGYAWIENENFAITEMEFRVPSKANLNFINDFYVNQTFEKPDGKHWFLTGEKMHVSIDPLKSKKGRSFLVKKSVKRNDIQINLEYNDSTYRGESLIIEDSVDTRSKEWWEENRVAPLTQSEKDIFFVVDSIKNMRIYHDLQRVIYFGITGYLRFGRKVPFEMGQVYKFFSWNDVEGIRLKFGGRTNKYLSKDFQLTAYGAYGLKDKRWKGLANLRFFLPSKNKHWHLVDMGYTNDFTFLGATGSEQKFNHDNLFLSLFRRDPLEKIMRIEEYYARWEKEWLNGFTTELFGSRKTFFAIKNTFEFNNIDQLGNMTSIPSFSTMEVGLVTKVEVGKSYFTNDFYRSSSGSRLPELAFGYTLGIEDALGGEFTFHRFNLELKQRWLNKFGLTKYRLRAGLVLGESPYPLFFMHQGNSNFYYSSSAYSNMGEYEYASDKFAAFWFDHHFEGKILNSIPLVKWLQFRSIFIFKALVGHINPYNANILQMPKSMNSTFAEKEKVYVEVGFGIENILKVFRVDFVWRLTQRQKQFEGRDVQKFAVKFAFQPKI